MDERTSLALAAMAVMCAACVIEEPAADDDDDGGTTSSGAVTSSGTGGFGGAGGAAQTATTATSTGANITTSSASSSSSSSSGSGGSSGRCDPNGAWSAPVPATELGQGPMGGDEGQAPFLTPDELTVYFERYGNLYVAERSTATGAFGTETLIDIPGYLSYPSVSPDGLTLFYAALASNPTQLVPYISERAMVTDAFTEGEAMNTPAFHAHLVRQTATGLYMISWPDDGYGKLYFSDTDGASWAPVFEFSSDKHFRSFALSADELTVYVTGSHPFYGDTNTYRATRASTSNSFGAGTLVDGLSMGGIGTDSFEVYWVSDDDCIVYGEYFDNGPDNSYVYRSQRAP
jgi:hypothetical protein